MNSHFMLFAAAIAVAAVLSVSHGPATGLAVGSSLWNDSRIADQAAPTATVPRDSMESAFWKY